MRYIGINKVAIIVCIFFFISSLMRGQESDITAYQKQIIGDLSGVNELDDLGFLTARSTSSEREKARKYLLNTFEEMGISAHRQKYTQANIHPAIDLILGPFRGQNIYATLPATQESNRYVIIGAHFDTERGCPGAIDNGSGVALVLSVFKKLQTQPERKLNIIAVLFDQEEENLNGSKAFAEFLIEQNYDIHSVHSFDAMGWDRDNDRAIEIALPAPFLDSLYRTKGKELGIPVYTTEVNASDHASFLDAGIPVTGVTDEYVGGDYAPYKDTPKDTFDTVNFEYLESCANLVFEVIQSISLE